MLVYHRLSHYASASLARVAARCLNSSATLSEGSSSTQPDSIFATKESPWDHILSDSINDMPPVLPSPVRNPLRAGGVETSGPTRARRQAMTAREISAFDEMFNMIFDAVSEQKNPSAKLSSSKQDDPLAVLGGIGRKPFGQAPVSDLFGKLRRHSKRLKWTTEADEEFDKKKEEMELCDTDQQLLEWAMREVFGQSQKYEERARNAIAKAEEQDTPGLTPSSNASASANAPPQLGSTHLELQHPTYPYLIAHLVRSFRDKYRDPHLALSIFDYARHLSIPSYVFGCTTPAYNELIETRWSCFRDLRGVHDALEEMRVNGVEPDGRTKKLVETLRREVGARTVWEEESVFGGGEVVGMLSKIEQLAIKEPRRKRGKGSGRKGPAFDAWKGDALKEDVEDGYEFGQWGSRKAQPNRRERDSERTALTGLDDLLDGKVPGEDQLEFK
ncbi:hypothetical protein DFJ58DRAFT_497402 [Suillus subalutaceus]|uniref:uncharacterized protein n=1 Tax=Suillus subalutaceus TaxID=48586 RepID=UPI001B870D0C|nr:uncharacterized protein DFJ58DRAFT_497402 [Suillus subalutaceus]KAG1846386.1 hypothetical protein DFJ58DRAFT_497402 [Suillus subalutaceus]